MSYFHLEVKTNFFYKVNVHPPDSVTSDTTKNVSLHFVIDKISMPHLTGLIQFYVNGDGYIKTDVNHINKNYTLPVRNQPYMRHWTLKII